MKKKFLALLLIVSTVALASDPVSIDSLFKSQQGLRSVTSLQYMSSGSYDSFKIYPELMSVEDGRYWQDTKSLSLTQTFFYDVTPKLDLMVTATGEYQKREYIDFSGHNSANNLDFDSLWLGGVYSFDMLGDFKPQITAQLSSCQRQRYLTEEKNFYFDSATVKASFRNFSDPVISNLYIGTTQTMQRKFSSSKVENGNSYFTGFDMSLVLSPKISLDFGVEERYQTESKIDGVKYSNSLSLPTLTIGATYSLNPKTSLIVSGSSGGSARSPDSIMSISLWKKF